MSLEDVMSGGNGGAPAANPTSTATAPQTGSDPQQGSGTGSAAEAGNIRLSAWTQQLSKEYRENQEYAKGLAGFEKLDDFAKSYFELSKRTEGAVQFPGETATPEEKAAFWQKLGVPEKADKYAVAKDENAGTFAAAAHAAHLTDEQATALWNEVSQGTARQIQALRETQARELAATDAALRTEYGDRYEAAVELMRRGMGNSGIGQALLNAGLAGNPLIVKAFIALGEAQKESGSPKSDPSPPAGMTSVFAGGSLYS
ncbi:MAG: hypothetical protein LBC31_06900 [Treponema sp.]|nr:hypothetical protein [Treponema sp.]